MTLCLTLLNFLASRLHKKNNFWPTKNNFWPTKNNFFAHLCRNSGFLYKTWLYSDVFSVILTEQFFPKEKPFKRDSADIEAFLAFLSRLLLGDNFTTMSPTSISSFSSSMVSSILGFLSMISSILGFLSMISSILGFFSMISSIFGFFSTVTPALPVWKPPLYEQIRLSDRTQ